MSVKYVVVVFFVLVKVCYPNCYFDKIYLVDVHFQIILFIIVNICFVCITIWLTIPLIKQQNLLSPLISSAISLGLWTKGNYKVKTDKIYDKNIKILPTSSPDILYVYCYTELCDHVAYTAIFVIYVVVLCFYGTLGILKAMH